MKKTLFNILFILSLSFSANAAPQTQIKSLLKSLFPFISANKSSVIKTHNCKIDKQKWTMLLLTQQTFKQTFKFAKGCDLDGTIHPKLNAPFPINLKVRKLKNYQSIKALGKISLDYKEEAVLSVELKKAHVTGKKSAKFDIDYAVVIDPLSEKIIKKHKGGSLHIKSLNGKAINKKIKLTKASFRK